MMMTMMVVVKMNIIMMVNIDYVQLNSKGHLSGLIQLFTACSYFLIDVAINSDDQDSDNDDDDDGGDGVVVMI